MGTRAVRRPVARKRVWIAVGAVVVGGAGIMTATAFAPDDGGSSAGKPAAQKPVSSAVQALQLSGRDGKLTLPQRSTEQFGLVGVTWTSPKAKLDADIEVRTHRVSTGAWSDWHSVEAADDDIPDAGAEPNARGGSAPLYVGVSDGVQARVTSKSGATGIPAGLRLDLVGDAPQKKTSVNVAMAPAAYAVDADPTDSPTPDPTDTSASPTPSDSPSPSPSDVSPPPSVSPTPSATSASPTPSKSASTSPSPTSTRPTAPKSTVVKPTIVTRAGWGADEKIREAGDPAYSDKINAVFVHHTDTAATYDCKDSASIVRWVYTYHVKSNGWRDVGYNFLVDKCGTIFEGRYGGMDLPIIGAHTGGFNTRSTGIAVLGSFPDDKGNATSISTSMLGSVAAVAAWKLGMYGVNPNPSTKTATLVAGSGGSSNFTVGKTYTFFPISGHRDGYATACPGINLYNKLPTIRAYAAGPVAAPTLTVSPTYTKGASTVTWTTATPTAVIKGFEVLVDGKTVASVSRSTRSAPITVAAGKHAVQIRATHINGKTSISAAASVTGDTTKPTYTTPLDVRLRGGTLTSTSIPVAMTWKAADNASLKSVAATAPHAATFGPTVTSWGTTAKPATAVTYTLKATDSAGNYLTTSVSRTAVITQETSATRSGTWAAKKSTSYLGGASYSSGTKNAALTWTFTGRSVAWVVSRASTSGQAYVYVDGVKVSTVDLKSSTTLYRQAIWTKTWSTAAKHTVKIVVVGTSGRPTVTTDGIAYVK
ncbi:peptidoglycan recognition protein [Streptomyces sp. NBC_01465]|uniref:peptidoglycan recognition protein n=1 Tax=Streptomyces sp. NBC_01465 TaxID=2903878 RepID=UPI002E2F37D9|nr:peptidoglycan recognition protein [Streptomyces sp. NBC_01465]